MTETDARGILHVARDASPAEIRRAYLDMVKVWHPDRFQSDARLRDKAQRTLQQINAAYTLLEHGAPASRTEPGGNSSPAPAPTDDTLAGDERHAWLQLHTVTAVCAGLTLGVALALALIFFRSTPAPPADLATESAASSIALPAEAPSRPASPAASPRPRPTTAPARPDSGTDIGRRGPVGRGALSFRSGLALDAVVELAHDAGHTRRLYLRRGEKVTLLDLVPGPYHVRVALGTDWNGRWFAHTSATLELAQQVTVVQSGPGAAFEALTLLPGDGSLRPAAPFGPD